MSDIINDTVKINKVHTNPKRGHKLGTASATWKKIKSATVTAAASTYPLATPVNSTNTSDDDITDTLFENPTNNVLIENGSSGEFFMLFKAEYKLEIWNWTSLNHEANSSDYGDTLFLNHQIKLPFGPGAEIQTFKMCAQQDDKFLFLIVVSDDTGYYLQSHKFTLKDKTSIRISSLKLQFGDSKMSLTLKASDKFVVVGSDSGLTSIFRFVEGELFPGNHNLQLPTIRKHSCNPILAKHSFISKVSDEDMILQTSVNSDSVPIFDIVDNWLVYSPTKFEYRHLKAINESTITQPKTDEEEKDPIITNDNNTSGYKVKNSMFTPMKLPISKPLLNKVFSTVSNTALDGLFKLSEMSSAKFKAYMNQTSYSKPIEPTTMNSISKSVGRLLYSTASNTANSLQNTTKSLKPNDNQIICVLDLGNDRVMGIFKPPGGISQLSLSPYDLQLVHANARGDSLYMWDLYRLPIEISLIGKFLRGKTSAIIEEIFWFINNYESSKREEGEVFGNNSGFGCISKSTGSLHWYNINYLAGSYNNNRPNSFKKTSFAPGKFMDSWILSSLKAKQFVSTPTNQSSNLNQLAIIDEDLVLKLISPLNGHHFYQFQLSKMPVDDEFVPNATSIKKSVSTGPPPVNPLSQAEIETCAPFLNLINNRRIEFATFEDENLSQAFSEFGNAVPEKVITFRSLPTYRTLKPKDIKGENELPSVDTLFIDQDEADGSKDMSDSFGN
ncbi:hypothetical protein JA1_001948 [Spathaspora sp. JA1]|nr:hypothetical protein JA1_001948 [Spathaspora sp. JA1]